MAVIAPGSAPEGPGGRLLAASPARLAIILMCVVAVYFFVGFLEQSTDVIRIDQRVAATRKRIIDLEAANRELEQRLAYLGTDGYIETAARDKLNLVKPGDRSLVVIPPEAEVAWVDGPKATPEASRLGPEFGHLQDWLALLFGTP